MYVIIKKTPCTHCGGAGQFYEENEEVPISYDSYPCPRCVHGMKLEEIDADKWLLERLRRIHIDDYIIDDRGPQKKREWPLKNAKLSQ